MWESLGPIFLGAGAVVFLIGFLMLVVKGFRQHLAWGLGMLVLIPAPLFVLRHFRKTIVPVLVIFLGVLIAGTPILINRFFPPQVDLGALERRVEGDLHITLTGWKPKEMDYSVLENRPDAVVLQMANEDVTDQTLKYLKGMTKLNELDLSNSQVTDEGLKTLTALPVLEKLYLNNTRITDEGVRQSLFSLEALKELNVRKTRVTKETREEWKAAKKGRKVTPAF